MVLLAAEAAEAAAVAGNFSIKKESPLPNSQGGASPLVVVGALAPVVIGGTHGQRTFAGWHH